MARFSILKVIGSALAGFVIAGLLTLAGFLVVNHRIMLGPHDPDEVQAWTWFAATMGSLGIGGIGLVVGAIYGIFWQA